MKIKKVRLGEQPPECNFWKDKSHLERLNMVEKLRRQFITDNDRGKVCEVKKIRIK